MKEKILAEFYSQFHKPAQYLIRSPGRVNIIGEHTDYNEGFVFPMAIDRATWLALCPRPDHMVNIISGKRGKLSINLHRLSRPKDRARWGDYLAGVAWALGSAWQQELKGFDALVLSDVPTGAGLSSSASFELALARGFAISSNLAWEPVKMAKLCQQSENQWVGVNCGIMDQLICAVGQKDHAVMIDCRSLGYQPVALPQDTLVVIMDTSTRRGLVGSAYNERRTQCEEVAKALGVKFLRDISLDDLQANKLRLNPLSYKRAYHVVSENDRVLQAVTAMRNNDPVTLGRLMLDSHNSLNRDFEVCNEALNIIVNIAKDLPGCFGARMTGAGFGGCAVALLQKECAQGFSEQVAIEFKRQTGLSPSIYITEATEGCKLVEI
ncbi:MAG: Galactokinase [Gammaproteobacteria bacterium]|jgi:galactokinase|nr:Galactokinase [Gammaproteobacteria bacterium]